MVGGVVAYLVSVRLPVAGEGGWVLNVVRFDVVGVVGFDDGWGRWLGWLRLRGTLWLSRSEAGPSPRALTVEIFPQNRRKTPISWEYLDSQRNR